jgi:hypothetical protein
MTHVASIVVFRQAVVAIFATLVVGAPAVASAHPPEPGAALIQPSPAAASSAWALRGAVKDAASTGSDAGMLLAAMAIVGMTIALWRGGSHRRLRFVGLALMLILGGYDGAIHSVHHLGDAAAADQCRVASNGENMHVVDVEGPTVRGLLNPAREGSLPAPPGRARTDRLAPDASRAPPASPLLGRIATS